MESAAGEEGGVVPLDDDTVTDTYNLSYDELQKNIVQLRKNIFVDDLVSLYFMREMLILADTRRDPEAISLANLAFAGAKRSKTQCLVAKNKKMENNL